MRKIFIPILSALALTIVAGLGNTGCSGCSTGNDTTATVTDTIDTTVVSARRSVEVQPLDKPDTTYLFEYPMDLDEQSRTSWVVGDTIIITYYKRGSDTESDSIVKIVKK